MRKNFPQATAVELNHLKKYIDNNYRNVGKSTNELIAAFEFRFNKIENRGIPLK